MIPIVEELYQRKAVDLDPMAAQLTALDRYRRDTGVAEIQSGGIVESAAREDALRRVTEFLKARLED